MIVEFEREKYFVFFPKEIILQNLQAITHTIQGTGIYVL